MRSGGVVYPLPLGIVVFYSVYTLMKVVFIVYYPKIFCGAYKVTTPKSVHTINFDTPKRAEKLDTM